jgi:hypothetical protein
VAAVKLYTKHNSTTTEIEVVVDIGGLASTVVEVPVIV